MPTPKQTAFLLLKDTLEVMYGGAAGGAKSWALLADAARDVDEYATKALILRKTFKDLSQPGGLFEVSNQWFRGTAASWDGNSYEWRFPSGAVIKFGYLDNETDHLRYQGGGYHIIAFDELTQLRKFQYLYLFSRIRRATDFPIKPRVRSATNPGGPGHEWVRKRFNLPHGPPHPENINRKFVSSKLKDNPHLDQDSYMEAMERLRESGDGEGKTDVTYLQLAEGDWSVAGTGGRFDPDDFDVVEWGDAPPAHTMRNVLRIWDMAASDVTDESPDPDWTAGVKIGVTYLNTKTRNIPEWWVYDVSRIRANAGVANQFILGKAHSDGIGIPQWFDQERGSAGKKEIYYWRNERLPGYMVRGLYATGTKESRAVTPANMVSTGRVHLINGPWVEEFKAEAGAFPTGDHDDMVDAFSNGFLALDREHTMMSSQNQRASARGSEGFLNEQARRQKQLIDSTFKGWA